MNPKRRTGAHKRARDFFYDQSGQAVTEYVILLLVLVGLIVAIGTTIRNKLNGLLQGRIGSYLQNQFFNARGVHRFVLRIPK